MSASSMARFGALVADRAANSGLTTAEFTTALAQTLQVPETRAKSVLDGSKSLEGFRLRSVISGLSLDREQVTKAVDADLLLTALWCPNVGNALAKARTEANLSREELAFASGISTASIKRWEEAQLTPRVSTLNRLLTVLGLTAKDLLPFGDWPPAEVVAGQRTVFSLWLRKTREHLGVSQGQLGRLLCMSQGGYNAWETGRTYPSHDRWEQLAQAFTDLGAPLTPVQLLLMQPPQPAIDPADSTPLGALISAGRYARRLSTAGAAHLSRYAEDTIKAWEAGVRVPKAEALARLVEVLELDIDDVTNAVMAVRFPGRTDRGAWIASRIHAMGWKDSQGASRIGVHRNKVSFWTTGKVAVDDVNLVRVARALHTTKARLAAMPAVLDNEHTRRAAALTAARHRTGLSQKAFGKQLGMAQSVWSHYERGTIRPSLELMTQILTLSLQPQDTAIAA